jgi:hypothetical protein
MRSLYLSQEPDVSIRRTARFCSLGPPVACPGSIPLDRGTPGEPSERFPRAPRLPLANIAPDTGES